MVSRERADRAVRWSAAVRSPAAIETGQAIGNYWPYATTIFDFTRRAMPWAQPKSLTNDEVYALTAYVLALNKIIGENDAMNAETLPKVKMPNWTRFAQQIPRTNITWALAPQGWEGREAGTDATKDGAVSSSPSPRPSPDLGG